MIPLITKIIGLEYEVLDWSKALDFLMMSILSLKY